MAEKFLRLEFFFVHFLRYIHMPQKISTGYYAEVPIDLGKYILQQNIYINITIHNYIPIIFISAFENPHLT